MFSENINIINAKQISSIECLTKTLGLILLLHFSGKEGGKKAIKMCLV
jgi:hypothetical protein